MDCVFCKIVEGEIPSYTVYEDDRVKVFLDIAPDVNGHMLIVPKEHTLDITSIGEEVWTHLLFVIREMKRLLEEKLHIDGLTLIQNNGDVQEVKHFHLHLKPYYREAFPLKDVEEIFEIVRQK